MRRGTSVMKWGRSWCVLLAVAFAAASGAARAQDFYQGRTVTIVVGYPDGGPAAAAANLYVRHFARFIPGNPDIVLDFRSGQSGVAAANYVALEAPRDGTVLGVVGGKAILDPILNAAFTMAKPAFDARQLNWIGAKSQDNVVCAIWHEAGVESLDDVRRRETKIGVIGPGTRSAVYAKLLNDLTATKFSPVSGFDSVDAILKGMEERKIDGHCGSTLESLQIRAPQWFDQNKLKLLVQFARRADERFPDVPMAQRVPRTDTGRRVMAFLASDSFLNQALVAPPQVPAERLDILRRAFENMWNDEAVREDAVARRIAVDPVQGADLQETVAQLAGAPEDVTWIVKSVLEAK